LLSGYTHRFLRNRAANPSVYAFNGCNTPEIRGQLATLRFDAFIVMGWYLRSYWQAVAACAWQKVPVLVRGDSHLGTPRSAAKKVAKQFTHRTMLRSFDGFLSVGSLNTAYLKRYGVPDRKIFRVPHFVDNEFFAAGASDEGARAAARTAMDVVPGEIVALFVGRLIDLKRPRDLVQAAARLNKASGEVVRVVFAGAGPLAEAVAEEARRLGVPVSLLGFRNQSELPAIYAASDFLVVSSDQETWGLVVNEAMASGIPAIVSRAVGCAPDMIVPGVTGFVYPAGDIGALAEAMHRAGRLARDPATPAALQRISDEHSCARAVHSTLEAVAQVRST
jgi:glycosyltransferase involved in cell wall biosynthesis